MHLTGIHAGATLALAAALERFHLAILLGQHRLCVWSPTHTHTYVRRHAPDGTCGRHALPLPLAENKNGLFIVWAQWILPDWLSLQSRWDG
jgi:hypothetical protein